MSEGIAHRHKVERIVACAGEVLSPQAHAPFFGLESERQSCKTIEILFQSIGLVPIDRPGAVHIGSKSRSYPRKSKRRRAPVHLGKEGVRRRVWHAAPAIVGASVFIGPERGVGVAITHTRGEVGSGRPARRKLGTIAACAPCVSHNASRGGSGREYGKLLVAAVYQKESTVNLQAVHRLGVKAKLVVETALRLVAHYLFERVERAHTHLAHNALLQHVAEHLGVIPAGLISLREVEIRLEHLVFVSHSKLGKKLHECASEAGAIVYVDRGVGVHLATAVGQHVVGGVAGVAVAAVIDCCTFDIEARPGVEPPAAKAVGALVVERESLVAEREIAAERETAGIPRYRIVGIGIIPVLLYQLGYAGVLECHGRVHIGVLVESEHAAEPAVRATGAARKEVFCHSPLAAVLRECEKFIRQEILVQIHTVVKILHRRERSHHHPLSGPRHGKAVGKGGAAVTASITEGYGTALHGGIRIAALPVGTEGGDIAYRKRRRRAPRRFPAQRPRVFVIELAAVVFVPEKAVGMGKLPRHAHTKLRKQPGVVRC